MPTALITGGSSGLGFAFAEELGKQGYTLILLARNKEKLGISMSKLKNRNFVVHGFQGDTTNEESLKNICNEIKNKFSTINLLILNAGVVSCNLLTDFKNTNELRHDLEINLWGTILSTYIFLPLVSEGSNILFISSAFGLMGPAAYSIYSASKAGIINFAESLRRELLCKNISVHVACPGDIDTPQLHNEHKNMPDWFKKDDPRKALAPNIAAKKILAKCSKGKFLIVISFDILALIMLNKVFPRRWRDYFLDKMFPVPKL